METPKFWMMNRASKKRGSSTSGNNRGRPPKIVVYCPECPIPNMANPEDSTKLPVSAKKKVGKCPKGHVVHIGGQSIPW
jgi:hypothetical protein